MPSRRRRNVASCSASSSFLIGDHDGIQANGSLSPVSETPSRSAASALGDHFNQLGAAARRCERCAHLELLAQLLARSP